MDICVPICHFGLCLLLNQSRLTTAPLAEAPTTDDKVVAMSICRTRESCTLVILLDIAPRKTYHSADFSGNNRRQDSI